MCNLSRGVWEQGALDKTVKIALELLKMKLPAANIIKATELTLEQLEKIARDNGLNLVKE